MKRKEAILNLLLEYLSGDADGEIETIKYTCDADVAMVFGNGSPMVIAPVSPRAKELFKSWGMDDDVTGIAPPENALDFIDSMPSDWTMGRAEPIEGPHLVQEIPLPQKISVVH